MLHVNAPNVRVTLTVVYRCSFLHYCDSWTQIWYVNMIIASRLIQIKWLGRSCPCLADTRYKLVLNHMTRLILWIVFESHFLHANPQTRDRQTQTWHDRRPGWMLPPLTVQVRWRNGVSLSLNFLVTLLLLTFCLKIVGGGWLRPQLLLIVISYVGLILFDERRRSKTILTV